MRDALRVLDLFAGIGGLSLAAQWAGMRPTALCEIDPYLQAVLRTQWPSASVWGDIHTLTHTAFAQVDPRPIDIIVGGFPCQPFSVIGKRQGKEDARALWGEMFRCVREFRPRWVLGENVGHFAKMGLDSTLSDLESLGYTCTTALFAAGAVGAPHARERLFVVGYAPPPDLAGEPDLQADATAYSLRGGGKARQNDGWGLRHPTSRPDWTICSSAILGVDDGLPHRLDRSVALGNAVVPHQAYPILFTIALWDQQLFRRSN